MVKCYRKSLSSLAVILVCNAAFAGNRVGNTIAQSATNTLLGTGMAVIMKNNDVQPDIVATPNGYLVVPRGTFSNTSKQSKESSNQAYKKQNSQQEKLNFLKQQQGN